MYKKTESIVYEKGKDAQLHFLQTASWGKLETERSSSKSMLMSPHQSFENSNKYVANSCRLE